MTAMIITTTTTASHLLSTPPFSCLYPMWILSIPTPQLLAKLFSVTPQKKGFHGIKIVLEAMMIKFLSWIFYGREMEKKKEIDGRKEWVNRSRRRIWKGTIWADILVDDDNGGGGGAVGILVNVINLGILFCERFGSNPKFDPVLTIWKTK